MSLSPPNLPPPPPPPAPRGLLAKLTSPKIWIPLLCVLAFVLVVLAAWWLSGSWLAALVTALAIALIVLVVVLLRVVFTQDREDRIERGIPEPQLYAAQQQAQPGGPGDLDGAFRRGIADLQGSKMGNDFYSLPWFLVIGESGSGKSDALQLSGLDVPPEFAHLRSTGPTRDCSFWFTNQAVLLDTAGRFVESEEARTSDEWRRLLQLLRSNRPGTPLDGLVVALSVDSLIGRSPQELADRAHTLRRRINELTDQLRVDVPIYILVTKADHLEGFVETSQSLPASRLGEAFGWTNDRRHFADAGELVAEAFDEVVEQLEHLLPEMMLREADPTRRRRLFLFPQEMRGAADAVGGFLRAAFAPSVYGEVPFLRGVYFTSAKREGRTLSPLLQGLGHEWAQAQLDPSGPAQGLFLLDVFREVALGDRDLAVPANWMGRRFRRFASISTAGVALLVMLLIGVSFVDNLLTVRRLTSESRLVVDGASSLAALDKLRSAIVETGPPGESIQRIPLNGFGLGGNLDRATARARETFTWAFGREFESPTKNRLVGKVREHGPDSFEALATLALDVTWLATRAPEEGSARPDLLPYTPIGRNEADMVAFATGYDSYVRWLAEPSLRSRVESERDAVNAAASRLLDLPRLEQWAAQTRTPVRYDDFGIAAPELAASVDEVHPAYTQDVWNSLVRDLVAGVQTTGGVSASRVEQFRNSYVQRYDKEWRDFLIGTPTDPLARGKRKDSPYLALVARIDQETRTDLPRDEAPPSWVSLLQEVRRTEPRSEEEPLAPWQRYEVELDQVDVDVEAAAEQGLQALDLARRLRDPQGTSFGNALDTVREIVRSDRDGTATRRLREVLSMPILDGSADVMKSALNELDQRWRDNIVSPFSGTLTDLQVASLYRPDSGELQKFREDNGLDNFYADGRSLPVLGDATLSLGKDWLAWMQHAEKMQLALYPGPGAVPEIAVRLEGIPSRVVRGSGMVVARRDLRLICPDDDDPFEYREGGGSHIFAWTPRCQEVSLRIWVRQGGAERELRPRKEYSGPLAFPEWLQRAQRLPENVLRWRLEYDSAELLVDYRLRSGHSILDIEHRKPVDSMRD